MLLKILRRQLRRPSSKHLLVICKRNVNYFGTNRRSVSFSLVTSFVLGPFHLSSFHTIYSQSTLKHWPSKCRKGFSAHNPILLGGSANEWATVRVFVRMYEIVSRRRRKKKKVNNKRCEGSGESLVPFMFFQSSSRCVSIQFSLSHIIVLLILFTLNIDVTGFNECVYVILQLEVVFKTFESFVRLLMYMKGRL